MILPAVFHSQKRNQYIYSPFRNQILISHPLIAFFYKFDHKGGNLAGLATKTKTSGIFHLEGYGDFPYSEFNHQYRKFLFLQKNGFFHSKARINLDGVISPADIQSNMEHIRQLIFEITEDCNLSCTYCTYSKFYTNTERGVKEPKLEEIAKTVTYFLERRRNRKAPLIISFYGGEPLKNMKLIRQVVSLLKALPGNTIPFRFTMTSNGIYLKKYIEYLVEHNFEVGISLDGDRYGNAFRLLKNNQPSYDLVVRNLDYVRDHHPAFFEKNINFMSVLHNRNNYGDLERFFREKYHKIPIMSDLSTLGVTDKYKDEFNRTFIENKKEDRNDQVPMERLMTRHPRVKEMADIIEKYSGMVFKNYYHVLHPKKRHPLKKKFIPTATCSPFSLRAYITAEGSILPCEHISRDFEIGQVNTSAIDIETGKLSEMFNNYYRKMNPLCNSCYLADNCKECMFNTGIETGKPSCDFYMSHKKFSQYLALHFSFIENNYPFYLKLANHVFRKEGT